MWRTSHYFLPAWLNAAADSWVKRSDNNNMLHPRTARPIKNNLNTLSSHSEISAVPQNPVPPNHLKTHTDLSRNITHDDLAGDHLGASAWSTAQIWSVRMPQGFRLDHTSSPRRAGNNLTDDQQAFICVNTCFTPQPIGRNTRSIPLPPNRIEELPAMLWFYLPTTQLERQDSGAVVRPVSSQRGGCKFKTQLWPFCVELQR